MSRCGFSEDDDVECAGSVNLPEHDIVQVHDARYVADGALARVMFRPRQRLIVSFKTCRWDPG